MASVPLQPPPFPLDQPVMPEHRQIGRGAAIDELDRRVQIAVHQWLIGPRRIGKTSVAKAAPARWRQNGGVALDVDLYKRGISSLEDLAGELARQAQAAGVGVVPRPTQYRHKAGRALQHVTEIDRVVQDLGYDTDVDAFEGSEESAVAALRQEKRPLARIGQEYHVPDISTSDWLDGLHERFAELGIGIDQHEIFSIVQASDGHPRRTMLIANNVYISAAEMPERTAEATLVELAIRDAQRDRSWT